MIKITALESEALEVLEMMQEFLARRDGSKAELVELMGRIRDLRVKLTNKQFGCASGKHRTECLCTEPEGYF